MSLVTRHVSPTWRLSEAHTGGGKENRALPAPAFYYGPVALLPHRYGVGMAQKLIDVPDRGQRGGSVVRSQGLQPLIEDGLEG